MWSMAAGLYAVAKWLTVAVRCDICISLRPRDSVPVRVARSGCTRVPDAARRSTDPSTNRVVFAVAKLLLGFVLFRTAGKVAMDGNGIVPDG